MEYPLNFDISLKLLNSFSLSDQESERSDCSDNSHDLSEIKAQLDVVNEDRERLKNEVKKLVDERFYHFNRLVALHMKRTPVENHIENLKESVESTRKECEENDKILNNLKEILGKNEIDDVMKENKFKGVSPVQSRRVNRSKSKLPVPSRSIQSNRSVSPYQNIFQASPNK